MGRLAWWWSRRRRAGRVAIQSARLWLAQGGPELGAATAFYSMFALAPLLVVAIAVAGMVFGPEAARGQVVQEIRGLVGDSAAAGIEQMIEAAWKSDRSGWAALIGVATLLVGASGVFNELRNAINRIGQVEKPKSALGAFVRARLMAFALVLAFGFLLVASLALSAVLAALGAYVGDLFPGLGPLMRALDLVFSTAVLTVAFAAFLRWLPDERPGWRAAWTGALVSALLFAIGKHFIGLYLGRASVTSGFGAAGSLAVVLLWVYYSAQILMAGAAVTWTLERGGMGVAEAAPSPSDARTLHGQATRRGSAARHPDPPAARP